jgi:hypothetical protein
MGRLIRNTAILAKIETVYGTDPTPTGAANAILISNASFTLNAENVSRDLIRGYIGASEQLVGNRNVQITFDCELWGSGAAGTAPAYGPLLRACGMAETISAGNRVEYNPISASFESVTIYYHIDGVLRKALGCRGTVEYKMGLGERPLMSFSFTGIDGGATATANPALTLTAWKTPLAITDPNAGDILLGCTYSAGALSGGTSYKSRGLQANLGNTVSHVPLLGGESVEITNRETTGSLELELSAAQEVTAMTDILANTLTSVGFSLGTTAGYKVIVYAPTVQRINPKHTDLDGNLLIGMDLRFTPSSGNDELRIVAL